MIHRFYRYASGRIYRVAGALMLLLCAAASPASLQAQTATVRGFIIDASDGQPLQGVNVILTNDAGALYGNATDNDGVFAVARVPAGRYFLRATFIGYQTYADTLTLKGGDLRTLNVELRPQEANMGELVVEAERETAGAAAVSAGLQTIRPSDIELIPSPDVSGDLVTYLQALPGVVSTGDRGGQLFIRGGEPSQNLVLLDGMLLYQPFHVIGFYSAFPSDIISSTDIYAGGYGGRYGGRLSSVIDVSARTGNKRRFAGAVSVAPFVSAARLEGPLVRDRVSFIASWRQSVIDQGASKIIDQPLPFAFDDQFAKLHAKLTANSQVALTGIRTYDRGIIGDQEADGTEADQVVWKNRAYGLRYLLLPSTLPVLAEVLLSTSRVDNAFGPASRPTRSSSAQQINAAANVTHYVGGVDVNWGLFLRTSQLESQLGGQFQNVQSDREFITEAGIYFEPEFKLDIGLRIQPGIRFQTFPSKGRTFIEPRLRSVWNLGIHRVSGAWGVYHQEITGLNDRRDAGDVFTAWASSPLGQVPGAMHFILGYQIRPASWLEASLEGFYKSLSNLAIPEWTAFPRFTTRLQPADGHAKGADLRVEVSLSRFYGFVSYGLSEVNYEARQRSLQYWYGTNRQSFNPPHDRRHQLNALASMKLYGFELSVRWQYGSGLPFSQSLGFDTFVLIDGPKNVLTDPGSLRVLYGQPYNGRLPDYHRLDVSLERKIRVGRHAALTIQGGLINAYDRANLFYLDLFTLRRVDQLPVIPSAGLKLEID